MTTHIIKSFKGVLFEEKNIYDVILLCSFVSMSGNFQ